MALTHLLFFISLKVTEAQVRHVLYMRIYNLFIQELVKVGCNCFKISCDWFTTGLSKDWSKLVATCV
jgi:hypothetical protein